ncbi:MAG: sensor histidine kinase [Reichenbachiella sp.]|uniref:sensor histidine kinase n=1 Tax=Reichenbachiella sp. TaxID=2184521 RepID=UPI0032665A88
MQSVKPYHHLLLWIFIFFFVLDYFLFVSDTATAVGYTFFEVLIYACIFYVNLHFLIPRFLKGEGKAIYFFGLLFFLILIYILYDFILTGLSPMDENLQQDLISFTLNYTLFVLISFLYWYVILFQQERQRSLALKNEKLQAELLLLKSQVSPHFLFNSLNNIYSLSVIKHDDAPVMIEKLSDLLRYVIYEGTQALVPLEREVELLKNYTDLQQLKKLKGGHNIQVVTKGVAGTQRIVPLLLINIVENCFKHGDMAYNAHAVLVVHLEVKEGQLHFRTENSYTPSNKKNGIGLENVRQQLLYYYPEKHQFEINTADHMFKINLQIDLNL